MQQLGLSFYLYQCSYKIRFSIIFLKEKGFHKVKKKQIKILLWLCKQHPKNLIQ